MRSFAFVDASNLFYGGEKSLGWKIDYQKLIDYLKKKYGVSAVFYFGGVETHDFTFDYLNNETVSIIGLEKYLVNILKNNEEKLNEADIVLIGRHLKRVRFYERLEKFGYTLVLKPVKTYEQEDGTTKRKANCDVDMTFYLMKEVDNFDRAIILSGDGDFLPVLKHLRKLGKNIEILARGPRTAKEIRQFAGPSFKDFVRLENALKYNKN
ncbi:MAG: NYN domain-containing protein [Candidatus Harrisonbacteria bacterium]|nr:NYN domain-containing protein [Candidatus Harrisonbacteria bacterium]